MTRKTAKKRESISRLLDRAAACAFEGDDVEVVRLLSPRFNPSRPNRRLSLMLASAYLRLGNTNMALGVAEKLDKGDTPVYEVSFLLGRIYEARGHYEAASDAYRDALESQPDSVEPRVRLAEMSLRVMDVSAARRWTRVSDVPFGMDPRLNLLSGLALMGDGLFVEARREIQLAADAGLQDPRVGPALADLDRSIADQEAHLEELSSYLEDNLEELPPGLAYADFAEDYVTCLMNLGRRAEARKYIEEAARHFPANASLLALRARVLLDSGFYDEALRLAGRVAELDGDDVFADWCRNQIDGLVGGAEERLEDYELRARLADPPEAARLLGNAALLKFTSDLPDLDAEGLCKRALEMDSKNRLARVVSAFLDFTQGDSAAAVAKYRRCVEEWNDAEIWAALGVACLGLGDVAEAYNAFRHALELCPDYDVPHLQLAVLALSEGSLERSARECRLALDANANSVPARKLMMECYLRMGRYDDAEELCMQLLDLPNADAADAYRALGNVWEARGDSGRAIECYSEALEEGPRDPRLLLDIGRLYTRHGQFEEAQEFLKNALDDNPKHPAVLDALGELSVSRGRLAEGIGYLRQAVEAAPGVFELEYHLALACMRKKDWRGAEERLKNALRARPYSAPALAALGRLYLDTGLPERAAQTFRSGLKCDPENFELLRGMAEMRFVEPEGEWVSTVEAWRLLRASVGCAPGPTEAQWALARLDLLEAEMGEARESAPLPPSVESPPRDRGPLTTLPTPEEWARLHYVQRFEEVAPHRAESPEQAERLITRAIQFAAGSPEPFIQRAVVRARLGRFREAIPDLSEAIRLSPRKAEIFFERGMLHHATGQHDAALADFSRALELDPRYVPAHEQRGFALLAAGRPRDAASEFTSALAVQPESQHALWGRARALLHMKQPGLAADDLSAALDISAEPALLNDRGECFRLVGDLEAAERDFRAAVERRPDFALAVENLARIHLALGEYERSMEDVRAALELLPDDSQLLALRKQIEDMAESA